ncbi:MAG: putative toxin-antitoxin system toxin component, PIN family [Zoogloeaceae bacterium]|nr:putative toxin-antitoxin system toxin component, PIN family [Zoogloeaceae bacterium]MCK6385621.1 putative toxin-antitoxin system toxin component, PIN family [Rhodocyclaceae bacterium]
MKRRPALRLALDTNVVLDLLHFGDPAVAPLRRALADGRAACFASAETRAELAHVLGYARFKMGDDEVRRILDEYDALARPCEAAGGALPPLPQCRDADDQKFLELALAARADLLVSKDKALLVLAKKSARLGFRIAAPAGAAALLECA